jgi:polysaccharide pyruvyl transferase WcaK-like protein
MLKEKERVLVVGEKHNACQLKYIISQCDYFVGSRMHSTLASLSSMVPTLSIAYSPKYLGINNDIFGHTDYVIPVQELDGPKLIQKFSALKESSKDIIRHLEKHIPLQKALAEKGGEHLAEILKNRTN